MCLALPAKVLKLLDNERALISIGGITKEISLTLLDTIQEGDYIIMHAGFALTRLDEEEAQKTLSVYATLLQDNAE